MPALLDDALKALQTLRPGLGKTKKGSKKDLKAEIFEELRETREALQETAARCLSYNEVLVLLRKATEEKAFVSTMEDEFAKVTERRDKVLSLLKYAKHVTGMAERPQVIEEGDNAKFITKGAKLMSYVLTETSIVKPPDVRERDAKSSLLKSE